MIRTTWLSHRKFGFLKINNTTFFGTQLWENSKVCLSYLTSFSTQYSQCSAWDWSWTTVKKCKRYQEAELEEERKVEWRHYWRKAGLLVSTWRNKVICQNEGSNMKWNHAALLVLLIFWRGVGRRLVLWGEQLVLRQRQIVLKFKQHKNCWLFILLFSWVKSLELFWSSEADI